MYIEQIVRTNTFLEEKEINLSECQQGINVISVIPQDSVVLSIDIEVLELGVGLMDVGVKDDSNYFASNINLATPQNTITAQRLSSKERIIPIVLDIKQAQTQGRIIFRMHFFGNQARMLDYTLNN